MIVVASLPVYRSVFKTGQSHILVCFAGIRCRYDDGCCLFAAKISSLCQSRCQHCVATSRLVPELTHCPITVSPLRVRLEVSCLGLGLAKRCWVQHGTWYLVRGTWYPGCRHPHILRRAGHHEAVRRSADHVLVSGPVHREPPRVRRLHLLGQQHLLPPDGDDDPREARESRLHHKYSQLYKNTNNAYYFWQPKAGLSHL